MQTISLIVAAGENDVIGRSGSMLPWHLSADLAHFKQLTLGRPIIMGRKTYDTIGRALPGRRNIVISRNPGFDAPGCEVVTSLEAALGTAAQDGDGEVFVIGGSQIFEAAMPKATLIHLTRVHAAPEGDAYFVCDLPQWHETSREDHTADANNEYAYSFIELRRNLIH
jgi:dihydrofolate reductase